MDRFGKVAMNCLNIYIYTLHVQGSTTYALQNSGMTNSEMEVEKDTTKSKVNCAFL